MSAEELTIRPAEWSEEALDALRAAELKGPYAGLTAAEDFAGRGAVLFEVLRNGAPVLWYVLEVQQHRHGAEGHVLAAAGSAPGIDLTARVLPIIEGQFRDVRAITIHTRRRGLVKKLARQGYGVAGVILRKWVNRV